MALLALKDKIKLELEWALANQPESDHATYEDGYIDGLLRALAILEGNEV